MVIEQTFSKWGDKVQSFGGPWTLLKLDVLEKYLNFFVQAMKNQNFQLCYIDAFAGSGDVDVPGIGSIPGSAVRAIDYPFDRYIFIDRNKGRYMAKSKIEWTENTWNPVTGCTKISDGCKNCYAAVMAQRLKLMGNKKYVNGFEVALHEYCLSDPLKWKKPSLIFVNSMSDLFHEDIPLEFIQKIFGIMNKASWHTFQVLTKRAERLAELAPYLTWSPNIWQGVTVESDQYKKRIDSLRKVDAKVRFISFEPLIDEVKDLDLMGIDWAIVGGESGLKARRIDLEWVLSIKNDCDQQGVSFYFKQWGGINKKKNGRLLLGQTWDAMPEIGAK